MTISSSWISEIAYCNVLGKKYLALFLRDKPIALLYSPVPSWLPGLLKAGRVGPIKSQGPSTGRAFNQLLKGRSDVHYQKVEGEERVNELRKLMGS